jgi:hypothetical protein
MRTQQLIGVALAALVLVAVPRGARAEPYLMVRAGAKCGDCHTNITGGGKRTPFAHIHAKDILDDLDILPIPAGVKPFNGEINSWVSIGSDLRVRNSTIFGDQPNAQGRVANNRAFRHEVLSNDTVVNEFLGYLQVDLWQDVAMMYVDEDLNGGANNREVFGLLRGFLPWDTYVKAGRMFPAYGLRIWDDDAYIRSFTGYTFQAPDEGAEVGFAPGPFFLASTVTNGTQGDTDVSVTLNGYAVFEDIPVVKTVMAGGSFARQSDKRHLAAIYAGSNLWRFTYLGEVDFITDNTVASQGQTPELAAYGELDFLVLEWLNFRGTFEYMKIQGDRNRTRWAIGAEPFLNRVIQPRIQYRINNGPENQPDLNQTELIFELHLFF